MEEKLRIPLIYIAKSEKNFFQRTEDDPNVFLTRDSKKMLLALDIPYRDGKTVKTIRKFYLGKRIKLD